MRINVPGVFNGGASIVDPADGTILQQTSLNTQKTTTTIKQIASLCEYVSFGAGKIKSANFKADMVHVDCLSIWAECSPKHVNDVIGIVKKIPGVVAHVNDIARDGLIGIQINHNRADKKHGALCLMQNLGLAPSEVLAIGDDHNDLPLFNAVGTSVAMGSAPESLKAVADYVVGDVAADGFAEAIKKYVLSAR